MIKKSLGETKRRKRDESPQREVEQEDDDTLKAHCIVIEKECKKKDGGKDYNKIFRLLSATREHRRKWMLGMAAPTRIAVSIATYPCLKKSLLVRKVSGCVNNDHRISTLVFSSLRVMALD